MARRRPLAGAFFAHWLLVAGAAFDLGADSWKGLFRQAHIAYGFVSGADNKYGFFAPNVPSEMRALVRVYEPKGKWRSLDPVAEAPAMRHRISTAMHLFREAPQETPLLGACWAAWGFGQQPDAQLAVVELQYFSIPELWGGRTASPGGWKTISVHAYVRTTEE